MSSSDSPDANSDRPLYLDDYFAECDEHLTSARHTLLALEPGSGQAQIDRERLEDLFRDFHSVKGLSAMVGLRPAETLAHQMESYLGALREGRSEFGNAGLSALVDGLRLLNRVIDAYRTNSELPDVATEAARFAGLLPSAEPSQPASEPPATAGVNAPLDRLDANLQARVAAAIRAGESAWWVTFTPSSALAQRNVNVNSVRGKLKLLGDLAYSAPKVLPGGQIAFVFLLLTAADEATLAGAQADGLAWVRYPDASAVLHESAVTGPPVKGSPRVARAASSGQSAGAANVVRVGLGRLDELMRMVGDLVVTRAKFEENLKQLAAQIPESQWRTLQENNGAFERQIRDLREGIMRVRLVPIRDAFSRMQFVVQDLTREYGKKVQLELSGEETEVDKLIVERIVDPLLHLVRNALSHGIESPAERASLGKPPTARISLRARTNGQTVAIEVEDDGQGIDAGQVCARARAAGLLPEGDDAEVANILDILCEPGFSTRDAVDRTSGRGVGMDVVKRTVDDLGGRLSLWTESGQGTRFTIQLPLTLSIADALIVEVERHTFAVPQTSVQEVFQLEPEAVSVLENNEVVYRRGTALPLVRLAALFGLTARSSRAPVTLVIGEANDAVGLVVDRVLGLREIVVRPLIDPLVRVMGISGATELGDGRIVLILDALNAIRTAGRQAGARSSKTSRPLLPAGSGPAVPGATHAG